MLHIHPMFGIFYLPSVNTGTRNHQFKVSSEQRPVEILADEGLGKMWVLYLCIELCNLIDCKALSNTFSCLLNYDGWLSWQLTPFIIHQHFILVLIVMNHQRNAFNKWKQGSLSIGKETKCNYNASLLINNGTCILHILYTVKKAPFTLSLLFLTVHWIDYSWSHLHERSCPASTIPVKNSLHNWGQRSRLFLFF